MAVDTNGKSEQTDKAPVNENEVGIGVDDEGFWHFKVHTKAGLHGTLGFLEMAKDAVKGEYIKQLREVQEKSFKLLRPDTLVDKFKGKFRN